MNDGTKSKGGELLSGAFSLCGYVPQARQES
jgi:hypothetical protein